MFPEDGHQGVLIIEARENELLLPVVLFVMLAGPLLQLHVGVVEVGRAGDNDQAFIEAAPVVVRDSAVQSA